MRSRSASGFVSLEVALRQIPAADVVGASRRSLVELHSQAHGRSPESARQRQFEAETLPRDAGRSAFVCLGAFGPAGELVGFAYGYAGARGQWWYDHVARAMDGPTRRQWLERPHFELCELAVLPSR